VFTETDPSALAGLPAGTIPSVTNCPRTVVPNTGLYQINCSGLRAQRSPTWTLNLGAEQAFDLSSDYRLILAGNTHFQTSSIVNFERRAFGIQDSYWLSDASLTLAAADDSWSIGAFVNNIEDTRVKGITSYLASTGTYQANYAPPRTYGMRLGFRIN
jgi:iron complex outermembrane receptor protein